MYKKDQIAWFVLILVLRMIFFSVNFLQCQCGSHGLYNLKERLAVKKVGTLSQQANKQEKCNWHGSVQHFLSKNSS